MYKLSKTKFSQFDRTRGDKNQIFRTLGFGDYLAFVVNDDKAGAPFLITIWGSLTVVIDS